MKSMYILLKSTIFIVSLHGLQRMRTIKIDVSFNPVLMRDIFYQISLNFLCKDRDISLGVEKILSISLCIQ